MRQYIYVFALIIPIVLSNCSSGKKAYEKGDYYSAVLKAVNRLRQNPSHKKSKEALKRSYPLALQTAEQNANTVLSSNAQFKYKNALGHYQQINTMYNEIRASPGALSVISNPKNYFAQVSTLKQQAAEESYEEALILLARDTREDAKGAYLLFREANSFVPNYKDVRDKMDEAKFMATLKVVVEQIPVPSRYNLSGNFFQDKIEEYLHTQFRSNEFVQFYTPREVKANNLPFVDQYLRLQFDDFVVGETHTERSTEKVSRDSVKTGTVSTRAGEKDVYSTVSATLVINRKEVRSRGLLSMRVTDADTKAVLTHRKFNGEFIWFSQWGNFNGDERALTEDQFKICQQQEILPPDPQTLFIEFTRPIYDQLVPAVNDFYRRY
ncbi:hypothetical protein [Fulvivirga sp.]|uniref:hypothetical protein n=1 Tax=Fulvivirga sp. TaxID=1931237 RepID=UPI0032EDA297